MSLLLFNLSWMAYNICLAIIPMVFGWFAYKTQSNLLRIFYVIIWFLFIPNTIYMLTDIEHLAPQFISSQNTGVHIGLIVEYFVLLFLGIITFILGMFPIEKLMLELKNKYKIAETDFILIVINFIIAFGVVIGRIQRTNSWDVALNPQKVVADIINTFASPELFSLVILLGILGNLYYFSLKNIVISNAWRLIHDVFKIK